jgi:Tfp pilus assembly protein PilF
MARSSSSLLFRRLRAGVALLALLAATVPSSVFAQTQTQSAAPAREFSEKTSTALGQLRELLDAKNYAAARVAVEAAAASAAPNSYDAYVLAQVRAQILIAENKLVEAIAPLETALRIGDATPSFVDQAGLLDQLNLLAQLHYQRGVELKDRAAQRAAYETALAYNQRWLKTSARPTAEVRLFAASLLYQLGTIDPEKTEAARIRESITQAREGLLLSPASPAQLRLILVAAHLQIGENVAAAELLELAAESDPSNASTWQQLQSIYLAGAADADSPEEARLHNLRALLVLERAQAAGQLNAPRDHYTRVAILFNLQQFSRAAELLEKGLADGSLENVKRHWELLASAYQQTGRDERALDALTRAVKRFPEDGALEFSLAQFLYNTGQVTDAYARGQAALAKPSLEKRGQVNVYLAYLAYELQRYDEATAWVEAARAAGDVPAATLDPLAAAITDALRARAAEAERT